MSFIKRSGFGTYGEENPFIDNLLSIINCGYIIWSTEGGILYWSEKAMSFYGTRPDSIEAFLSLIHSEDVEMVSHILQSREALYRKEYEFQCRPRNNSEIWLSHKGVEQDGYFIEFIQDISGITRIESGITDRFVHIKALLGASTDLLFALSPYKGEYVISTVTPSINRLGYRSWEVISQPIKMLVEEREHDSLDTAISKWLDTAEVGLEPDSFTLRLKAKSGEQVPFQLKGQSIPDSDTLIINASDVSEWIEKDCEIQRLQAALTISQNHFRLILDTLPIGVALVTQSGRVLEVNSSLKTLICTDPATHETYIHDFYKHLDDHHFIQNSSGRKVAVIVTEVDFPLVGVDGMAKMFIFQGFKNQQRRMNSVLEKIG